MVAGGRSTVYHSFDGNKIIEKVVVVSRQPSKLNSVLLAIKDKGGRTVMISNKFLDKKEVNVF